MGLPINIETLVHGRAIEWERLEFKRGWNPEEAVHTMCAFANDLNNWGGGYIIIGAEERDGQPVLPPEGLAEDQLDRIQGEIISLSHQVTPHYFPIVQPYILQDKYILVLWCPAGDNRPYTAPHTQGNGASRYAYVRHGSRSIIAKGEDLRRLTELAARIPFDDRVNHQASIQDFDLGLIQAFLQEVKSDLYEESKHISLADLTRNMHIAKGSDEALRPVNVGLLFFTTKPERFFPRAWIELVWHRDDTGSNYTEHYFKGALHIQLRDALAFLKTNIIREHVQKVPYQAEAIRFYNFPYAAVEEALSNAIYHRSYELGSPVEVQVWHDKIEVLSYPGPVPPVDAQILRHQRRIVARDYRNRRIGDFLKELDLTEGRGTGFPTIYKAMADNGSPDPVFDTNEQCTYFLAVLPAHAEPQIRTAGAQDKLFNINNLEELIALTNTDSVPQSVPQSPMVRLLLTMHVGAYADRIIASLAAMPLSRRALLQSLGLSGHIKNKERHIDPLLDIGWVTYTNPENLNDRNQKYKLTASGQRLLRLIGE